MRKLPCILAVFAALFTTAACAQQNNLPKDDLDPEFKAPARQADFEKRVVMMPMRDGVKLYTVIVIPRVQRTRQSCSTARHTTPLSAPNGPVALT